MTLLKTAICAVTGEVLPLRELVRFAVAPDGRIVPDVTNKLPGTFIWVKADRAVIQKAIWRNSFASHTRQNVTVPGDLMDMLVDGLQRQTMQTLSLAKRAGDLTFGYSKVDESLRARQAAIYVVSSDAQDNGREKLERLAKHQELPVLDAWTSAQLSAAIGEENIMHICLKAGGLTQNLLELETKLKAIARTK